MSILLGVDTGGTYTDAVLIKDETTILASAKALTTRGDLAVGVVTRCRRCWLTAVQHPVTLL